MIFSIDGHVEHIIAGTKTETRRNSGRYRVGQTYAVQRCRTCKGIAEGRILITLKWVENRVLYPDLMISSTDAALEGGYTPETFEALYEQLHPQWSDRVAYHFTFMPTEDAP